MQPEERKKKKWVFNGNEKEIACKWEKYIKNDSRPSGGRAKNFDSGE